jgi:aryl-phospho-beta-D-glucosidase BglC (GH1 family)
MERSFSGAGRFFVVIGIILINQPNSQASSTNLYGGVPSESLNVLRYKKFANKVVTSKEVIQIHTLPPTTEAAVYQSLRVYYQVQI